MDYNREEQQHQHQHQQIYPKLENGHVVDDKRYLIIIIPGIFGNELYRLDKDRKVIVYPPSYIQFVKGKISNLFNSTPGASTFEKYILDPKSKLYPGKIIKSYMGKNVYESLFTLMHKCGVYSNLNSVVEFTYDWRQPLHIIASQLIEFIELQMLKIVNKNNEIILFGHSYGGYILRIILETHYSFFKDIEKISKCVFFSTPFFGQHNLYKMYENLHAIEEENSTIYGGGGGGDAGYNAGGNGTCKIYTNTTYNVEYVQQKRDEIIKNFVANSFFTPTQLFQLFSKFKHSILPLIRLGDLNVANILTTCKVLGIDINYYNELYKIISNMATLENKRSNIEYICIYNTYNQTLNNAHRKYLTDGLILYNSRDLDIMAKCINFKQIRECDNNLSHSEIFNSRFVLQNLEHFFKTL
uniref:Putative lecithine cholesterol acyltransferase n=1 Tax=Drosophila-associated filamentous virus TaxID=2743186 RepID=A0A6M9U021_9VIRU|nr:putative lecithine cholesterol acyltransferase [Drosophila-associated filamentous virus]